MWRIIIVLLLFGELLVSINSADERTEDSTLTVESVLVDATDEIHPATLTTAAAAGTATVPETLECPSTNVIHVKYKCPGPSNSWTDCTKSHCCPGYNLINGNCISANINPCNLNLCEQQCAFIFQRIVCTCWDGYKFTADNQKRNNKTMCIDIDECKEGTHDCQHICQNTLGSFICDCEPGFSLLNDNKTCVQSADELNGDNERCVTNCKTVQQLQRKVTRLQEKLTALEIAVSLSIHGGTQFSGRPGPSGPPGPPGPPGSPGSPGALESDELHHASTAYTDRVTNSNSQSVLDSFIQTDIGYCKCQRGPIGPQGPTGTSGQKGAVGDRGPRGVKGATGDLDFLLLILADIRHDISLLQERIFPGEILPKFNFEAVSKRQRSIFDTKLKENDNGDDIKSFRGTKELRISDYTSEERFFESSGEEWDHYEE